MTTPFELLGTAVVFLVLVSEPAASLMYTNISHFTKQWLSF